MLCTKFSLNLIKVKFLKLFKNKPKIKGLWYFAKFRKNGFEIIVHLIFFPIHIHVLILCQNFELTLMKIETFINLKIQPKTKGLWYFTKFHQKWLQKNSPF